MKRLLACAAVIGGLAALGVSHEAIAAPPAKVQLCHVNSSNTVAVYEYSVGYYNYRTGYNYAYQYEVTYHLGRVIEVNQSAVEDHVANHGDTREFYELTDLMAGYIDEVGDRPYSFQGGVVYYPVPPYRPWYRWWFWEQGLQDGEIGNANCYWTTVE